MLYYKSGFPEEDEIVLCKITNIQYNSVFANLMEYGLQGMIHISEVSPGRIRNIRDYVTPGKVVVCKILRINRERGHIDLSLRRVNSMQRKEKISEMKQEQKAENIVKFVAKSLKKDYEEMYKGISSKILKKYEYIHDFFKECIDKPDLMKELGIGKEAEELLLKVVTERMKPKEVFIRGILTLRSYAGDGLERIKRCLEKGDSYENTEITYLGGGRYLLITRGKEYKSIEGRLKELLEEMKEYADKNDVEFSFSRETKQ